MADAARALEREAREYYAGALAFSFALTGHLPQAEELATRALARALTPRARRRGDVAAVARAVAAHLYARRRSRRRIVADAEARLAALDEEQRAAALAAPQPDALLAEFARLEPFARACVALRFHDDLTASEVAARLRAGPGRVRRAIDAAAPVLRQALGAEPDQERIEIVMAGPGASGGGR